MENKKSSMLISIIVFVVLIFGGIYLYQNSTKVNDTEKKWGTTTEVNKDGNKEVDTDSNTWTETNTTWTGNSEAPKQKFNMTIIDEPDSPMVENLKKDPGLNLTFLSTEEENEISKFFINKMKEEQKENKKIVLKATPEGIKQWAKDLEIPVVEHYPLLVFKDSEKKATKIDLDAVKKENPDFVWILEKDGEKYFAFKSPIFLQGIKRVQVLWDTLAKSLESNSILVSWKYDENKKTLVFVEDPLCPYCATEYTSDKTQKKLLKEYNVYLLPLALPSHPNADKLASIWLANKDNAKINDLVVEIYKKQAQFQGLDFNNKDAIKSVIGLEGFELKTEWYNDEAVRTLATELGVSGTPSKFILDKKTNKIKVVLEAEKEIK